MSNSKASVDFIASGILRSFENSRIFDHSVIRASMGTTIYLLIEWLSLQSVILDDKTIVATEPLKC